MSNLPLDQKKLVASTIKKAVQDGKPELSPQEFAGMLAFVVSVNTLSRIYDEGAYKEENENDIKSHLQKGINFVKRRRPAVEGAVRAYFSDYVDKLRFKTYFKRLMRGKRPWTFVDRVDELLTAMLPRLLRDLTLVQEIFSGRSLLTIRQLGVVIEEEGLQARMHKLASMTPSPGMAKEHNWIRKAGKLADVGVTEVEDSIASSFEAKDLASELQKIQTRLSSLDPSSQDAVELQERKQDILNSLEDMVDEAEDPSAIKAVISDAASQNPQHSYATDIGKELSLSPEQEEALLSRGKTIIAAGAGSGKTRVLAGKIVYHVKDLGLQPSEIVACSFTRKSSEELKRRITSYGVDLMNLDSYSSMGFGTTHSFAGKMLGHYANDYPYAGGGDKMLSNYENLRLLKLAIWQTMMKPKPRTPPEDLNLQDEDMTFFPNLPGEGAEEFGPAEEDDAKKERMRKFELALDAIRDYTEYSVDKYHNGRVPDWAESNYNLVHSYRGADPADLTEKEKETLNRVFEKNATQVNLKWKGIPNYKLSAVQKARNFLKKGRKKSARGKSILSKKDKEKLEWKHKYYYNNPANKWFNLGLTDNDFMRGHGEDKEPIPKGELILFIDNQKGRLNAPGKVMEDVAGDENVQDYIEGVSEKGEFIGEESKKGLFVKSAVYGAYQWLLQNEEEVKEKRSHTDVLIDVSKMMIERPDILEKVQKRFKAIFVDEAQDLNPAQHLIFGLVSGTYDPITQEPKEDGEATADTYCLIGDDKQCVDKNTLISTPKGAVPLRSLSEGSEVLSFRNGEIKPQKISKLVESSWTWGYQITTESGRKLTMSPNHKIWATDPCFLDNKQRLVYLMYREDLGFRVGITGTDSMEKSNPWGSRPYQEKADKLWILNICSDLEEALILEQKISLKYGVPTSVFEAENRNLSKKKTSYIFKEFGPNGHRVLHKYGLSFELPHWMSGSYSKFGKKKRTIYLNAHSSQNSQVTLEWSGSDLEHLKKRAKKSSKGNYRIRRYFSSYQEALSFALSLQKEADCMLRRRISTPEGMVNLLTASALFEGMKVIVESEDQQNVLFEKIESIEEVEADFLDIQVDDASNFFGGGILSHNSIYEWRGAAPEEFIEKSDAYSSGSGEFDTKLLTMNFRSGNSIVQAANNLIAHNNKQIKMECKANVDQKGEGRITEETLPTIEDCADYAASSIKDQIDNEDIDVSYDDFGVACRTTRELIYFTSSLISRGIPFRSKKHPFKGPVLSGLISMLSLMSPESRSRDEINEAVVKGVKSPDFGLSPYTMKNKLEDLARGKNYYTFFVEENGYRQVYRGGKWGERAERYANFLEQIYGKAEEFGPEGAVNFLLNYEGPYGSLLDSLVEKLKDDPEMIETILEENMDAEGATEDLIRAYAMQPLDPLRSVLDHFGDIDESVEYINTVVEKSKALSKTPDPNKPGYDEPAVSLDTVHGWKGLEAAHVFVPMYESQAGGFPHSRSVGDENLLEAERRLAYVAITRGEDRVTILRPSVSPFSESIPARTSRFVTEACIKTDTGEREKTSSVTARGKGLPEDLLDLYLNEDFDAFNEGVEMLEELEQNEENH